MLKFNKSGCLVVFLRTALDPLPNHKTVGQKLNLELQIWKNDMFLARHTECRHPAKNLISNFKFGKMTCFWQGTRNVAIRPNIYLIDCLQWILVKNEGFRQKRGVLTKTRGLQVTGWMLIENEGFCEKRGVMFYMKFSMKFGQKRRVLTKTRGFDENEGSPSDWMKL